MILTIVARSNDALILAMSTQFDDQDNQKIEQYQRESKQILKRLLNQALWPCQVEVGDNIYYSISADDVCFLVLCDKKFSKKMAFSYLEDIKHEFLKLYSNQIEYAKRPYSFVEFDDYMEKSKSNFTDIRKRRHYSSQLNDELQDVHKIMMQNIEGVLQRGETLSILDDKASKLKYQSESYRKDAKNLYLQAYFQKYGLYAVICLIIFIIFIRYKYF